MDNLKAYWSVSLDTECPHCEKDVDLLRADDFWNGVRFQAIEHDTDSTTGVSVVCPECCEEFVVDFAY